MHLADERMLIEDSVNKEVPFMSSPSGCSDIFDQGLSEPLDNSSINIGNIPFDRSPNVEEE